VFAWGIGPILFLAVDMSMYSAIFYRAIFWPPMLFLVIRLRHIPITQATMKVSLIPGILFGTATMLGFIAVKETSVANASIIGNLSAALVLIVAPRMFNEHVSRPQVLFSVMSFVGVVGVVLGADGAGGAKLSGDFIALMYAILWAAYFVSSKRARASGITTWAFLFGISISGLLVIGPVCVILSNDIGNPSLGDLGILLAVALIPGTMGQGLMVWAHRFVNASVTSLIGLFGPVISMVAAWIVYDQNVTLVQMLGAAVVLVSLAGVVRYGVRASVISDVVAEADPLLNSKQ